LPEQRRDILHIRIYPVVFVHILDALICKPVSGYEYEYSLTASMYYIALSRLSAVLLITPITRRWFIAWTLSAAATGLNSNPAEVYPHVQPFLLQLLELICYYIFQALELNYFNIFQLPE
jgi:hypothetical protein